ncbi:aldehyde dehydrogenase family protein [Polynucleobacter paneuropaeus]|jgi:coniferyl-aldehyde dehydrogenase|uniref:Aldehyde dehydrogenase n=1 Tax=Polynucleobacter paneuropaeus TaxID=2527775 RepID=A0A2Z4JV17_9BURK|nr:aldehyde dehydrogenase family protein [Polynucleobacter paneuropaeus]AWW50092.1 coniferyl aldehyde dehydrogenase [Polynucleobacter paneuropaeus]MBT8523760.1 aldehyde dehydrogenase family protein [Polynucleobacter paneuropaeus]MBT8565280.1 aldehyde dehydrogenase family protein [Polynucleobacter paneuropaeus]MBT8574683.1 aldehyde dehydrogenase family protein [Polynucleobacter paneuropaeus]MBT8614216.1 aldehyde dehydrogenase family protein [Polynucleobacter paneuropaeus]
MNRFTLQLEEIKTAYIAEPNPSLEVRLERIRKIEQMITANEDKICKALEADFGFRHPMETRLAEFGMIYQACKHTSKHLKEWMKPTQVETPGFLGSSQAWIESQSIGVVGILSPWNYPIHLALLPAIAAIAAGNRVWLKTSERSSRTSGFLAGLIQEYFHPTEFCVSTGGPDVAEIFASLPFDHLFFTGSEVIAKKVMRSAAENLTPVTLELGGKSPAVIDSSAKLADAAASIVYGKLINAGQTCIAPDYVLLQQGQLDPFVAELKQAAQKQYSADTQLTGPIDENQLARWKFLVEDAVTRGAQVIPLLTEVANENFMPVALLNVSKDAAVMQEEIFGPILPIVVIEDINAAITYVNSKPNPLALYWFGRDNKNQVRWISETRSGGMTINDTLLHAAVETLPFGGIGASGMGAYRGKTGFDTLSHQKSVLEVHSFLGIKMFKGTNMARPPYGKKTEFLLRLLK